MPRNNGIAHVAFDHEDSLRSREFIISWLTPTPHAPAVYASCSASPPPHATLASRRLARPYLGRICTGWGSRQLCLAPSFIRSPHRREQAASAVHRGPPPWRPCG